MQFYYVYILFDGEFTVHGQGLRIVPKNGNDDKYCYIPELAKTSENLQDNVTCKFSKFAGQNKNLPDK